MRAPVAIFLAVALAATACSDDVATEGVPSTSSSSVPTASQAPSTSTTTTTTLRVGPDVDNPDAVQGLTGAITPAPDPDFAREGDWYYAYTTGPGVPILRSQDLSHWESAGSVFDDPHPAWLDAYEWVGPDDALGAPDVEWFGDRWHLYYHSHMFTTNNAVTGHASNVTLDPDDPDYEWIDDGLIMSSSADEDDYSVLDANATVDEDGVPWMSFGSFWTGIQLVELDPETGAPVPDAPFTVLAIRDPWFKGVEASSMAFRDGYWYLFVSWGFCCQGVDTQYEIRVGRSADITGPYVDVAGTPMLEDAGHLLLGAHEQVRGPGSGDVLVTDDDSWLIHHWYDGDNDGEVTLGVRPLLWSPDGWPIAADPGFEPAAAGDVTAAQIVGSWELSQGEEPPFVVELGADGVVATAAGSWSYDDATGALEITLEGECTGLAGLTHTIMMGASVDAGFGYSDAALALRAVRNTDEDPTPTPC